MMTHFQAALLGIIQGLTEFLPVSSSGHLALAQALLGIKTGDVTFEVIVHFGTMLAVITVLRRRIQELLIGLIRRDPTSLKMIGLLALASVPAAVVGLTLQDTLSAAFANPFTVSILLVVTGIVLFSTRGLSGERMVDTVWTSIAVGIAQATAVFPGISRSGFTIATGLWCRVEAGEAATFSFLLAIPITAGATAVKVGELAPGGTGTESWSVLLVGAVAAYISGVLSIRWMLSILGRGELVRFAYYCLAVGIAGTIAFWA
ncbi:MAG: undecaprenyl-diphosphate phosphatase [Candidatus Latescibacterota bacterium]|nr:undecaprenyl-diphosphate phosphatase [Candidatus Latescibacterota bacterium]